MSTSARMKAHLISFRCNNILTIWLQSKSVFRSCPPIQNPISSGVGKYNQDPSSFNPSYIFCCKAFPSKVRWKLNHFSCAQGDKKTSIIRDQWEPSSTGLDQWEVANKWKPRPTLHVFWWHHNYCTEALPVFSYGPPWQHWNLNCSIDLPIGLAKVLQPWTWSRISWRPQQSTASITSPQQSQ